MQTYTSGNYTATNGSVTKNMFLILSMEEKEKLAVKVKQLELDRDAKIEAGKLEPMYTKGGALMTHCKRPGTWIGKDEEAIVFLKRMCLWLEWDFSENIDPTMYQIDTIVDKTIQKIYGPHIKFYDWMKLQSSGIMTRSSLGEYMQDKRDIVNHLKQTGRLPEEFIVP